MTRKVLLCANDISVPRDQPYQHAPTEVDTKSLDLR